MSLFFRYDGRARWKLHFGVGDIAINSDLSKFIVKFPTLKRCFQGNFSFQVNFVSNLCFWVRPTLFRLADSVNSSSNSIGTRLVLMIRQFFDSSNPRETVPNSTSGGSNLNVGPITSPQIEIFRSWSVPSTEKSKFSWNEPNWFAIWKLSECH